MGRTEALAGWSGWFGLRVVAPLTGGARNEVFLAQRGRQRLVLRRSTRPPDSLEWELDLREHLGGNGIGVPQLILADDGRRHVDGWTVATFVAGHQPRDITEWRRVIDTVTAVHGLTPRWPQRPGFASARDLLTIRRGGDVDLGAMPPAAVRAVRQAWKPVLHGTECAIHADLGADNVLVDGTTVTLLDWDEARVDVPWFDFAFFPENIAVPTPTGRPALTTAGVAWEAATCWVPEPNYAARRSPSCSSVRPTNIPRRPDLTCPS